MSNLLPFDDQKKMWAMYRSRFIIVTSIVMLVLAVVGFAALIPGYLALTLSEPGSESVDITKSGTDPLAMTRAQALINTVSPILAATSSPTDVIISVVEKKPAGIRIDQISYTSGQITLGGTGNRETVTAYRATLSADNRFQSVAVPVAALVGSEGNRFSMTISGSF